MLLLYTLYVVYTVRYTDGSVNESADLFVLGLFSFLFLPTPVLPQRRGRENLEGQKRSGSFWVNRKDGRRWRQRIKR